MHAGYKHATFPRLAATPAIPALDKLSALPTTRPADTMLQDLPALRRDAARRAVIDRHGSGTGGRVFDDGSTLRHTDTEPIAPTRPGRVHMGAPAAPAAALRYRPAPAIALLEAA
jgi:hypothetical protein